MKSSIKIFLVILIISGIVFSMIDFLGDVAYGDKWKYRGGTDNMEESIKRGVFVKELHFKIDSFSGPSFKFAVFIEKGYKYGRHTVNETIPISGSDFPFQLMFPYRPNNAITVRIRKDQLQKFDSSNASWGYLKKPQLNDTIILDIMGENIHSGLIKVW